MTLRLNCYIFRDDLEISSLQYTKSMLEKNNKKSACERLCKEDIYDMKRKCVLAAGIMLLLMAAEGCGNGQETADRAAQIPVETVSEEHEEGQNVDEENTASPDPVQDSSPKNEEEKAQETMIIGGKVREIMEDGFVISRVQYADDDMTMVVLPEEGSPEEELVTVRCTDSTAFEHWVIQGGGAGIDMNEATFADIQKGGGLETEGYFDGDNFVAEKVIIETYK